MVLVVCCAAVVAKFVGESDATQAAVFLLVTCVVALNLFTLPGARNAFVGMLSLPIARRKLFRTSHLPFLVVLALSAPAAALCASFAADDFHLTKDNKNWRPYPSMWTLNVEGFGTLSDLTQRPEFWVDPASAGLREAAAGTIARDIEKRYGVPVAPSEILLPDPSGGWTLDSSLIRPRLAVTERRAAITGVLAMFVAYLYSTLFMVHRAIGGSRRRLLTPVVLPLPLFIVTVGAACFLSGARLMPAIPMPRAFLVAHFAPIAVALVVACVALWFLSEHFFEDCEIGWMPPQRL